MAFWNRTQSVADDQVELLPEISLTDIADRYEIVQVTPGAVIVTPRRTIALTETEPDLRELGTTGMSSYGSIERQEYNNELRGLQGLLIYDKMRRGDAQVKATLRLVKTPVVAARWFLVPATDSKRDKKVAEFVHECIFKYQSMSWPQLVQEILLMLDFGYYALEKVWEFDEDGKLRWKKLAPRHPLDNREFVYDENGGPRGLLVLPRGHNQSEDTFIDIDKLLVFSFDKEAGNMEGLSILRSAYKHWYYKDNLYKVDAIQKERHGIGIPVIQLPMGFKPSDKVLAEELGRNLRTNEKAHVVLPPNWIVSTLKLEGQPVNVMTSIEHHDLMIARNILGQFINSPNAGAGTAENQEMFLKSTRFVADVIRDVFNKYAIPELVKFNFPNIEEFPELRVRRIGDIVDWRTISFAVRNLVGAQVIMPDDELEAYFRDEMDLPLRDKTTTREAETPQAPGSVPGQVVPPKPAPVGPPRQATAANANKRNSGKNGRDGGGQGR